MPPGPARPEARGTCGSRAHRRLLRSENAVDDLLYWRILDGYVCETAAEIVHQSRGALGRHLPFHAQGDATLLAPEHGAVRVDVGRRRGAVVKRGREHLAGSDS